MSNPIPAHVPDRVRTLLVVPLRDLAPDARQYAKVLVLEPRAMIGATVSRLEGELVHFKRNPPLRGYQEPVVAPRPLDEVWVDMRTEDGRSLLLSSLLPLLVPTNPHRVRSWSWRRQDNRRATTPTWVAVGLLHDQWIGPPGAGDVDHVVPGLRGDMDLTQALLHVWAWAKARGEARHG